jgi:hypothetical protein
VAYILQTNARVRTAFALQQISRMGQEVMNEVKAMRIIVGYNGSDASKAAITDLHNSGFGDNTEVLVLTVAEEWSFPARCTRLK